MALGRLRVALALDRRHPLGFLSRCSAICTSIDEHKTLFPNPTPPIPVVLGQIQDATAAQQLVSKVKGSAAARDVAFGVLVTSMESERTMVQMRCDQSPEQAATLIAAASMKAVTAGTRHKELLTLKNGLPSGTVLLAANAGLLDGTSRHKTYNWESTSNGGTSYVPMPSTPYAKTSIANLTPLTTVGFRVSVTAGSQPQGPWSQTVSILVR